MEVDDEWMVGLFEHFGFSYGVLQLLLQYESLLFECFECIADSTFDMPREKYFAECSRTEGMQNLERREIHFLIDDTVQLTRELFVSCFHLFLQRVLLLDSQGYF